MYRESADSRAPNMINVGGPVDEKGLGKLNPTSMDDENEETRVPYAPTFILLGGQI